MDLFAPLLRLFGPPSAMGRHGGSLQNALASGFGGALLGRAVCGSPQAAGNIGFVPELTSQLASSLIGGSGSSRNGGQDMLGHLIDIAAKTIFGGNVQMPNINDVNGGSGFVDSILSIFDSNHDGLLTRLEAKKAASQFDIGSRELKDILKGLNCDKKTEEVALSSLSDQIKLICVEKFKKAAFKLFFNCMDKDKSGTLSMDEVIVAVRAFNMPVTMSIAKEIFDSVDTNKDGEIDLKEFLAFLASVKDCV
ncbi:unnamed protein product [Hymenolepis diminuta]|uniref:EF-hand domain-containing protein n=1 Tax=Hymenolepis diminuta TaxID=6216 RepID=A0A564Z5R4_HYMDI|nr:unnamed protein product [Hymenolepis diminuta]